MTQENHTTGAGSAKVWLGDSQTIVCKLTGYITGGVVDGSMRETRALAQRISQDGRRPYLLLDISDVTGQTSGARSAAKELGTFNFRKIAVFGGGRMLNLIAQYIIRSGSMGGYTRLFRTEKQAVNWLHQASTAKKHSETDTRVVLAVIVIAIATVALIGWAVGSPALKATFPAQKPANPVLALLFMGLAAAIVFLHKGPMSRARRAYIVSIALLAVLFGGLVLLGLGLHINLHADTWLFSNNLQTGVFSGRTAPRAAVGCVLLGGMILLVATGQRRRWQQYAFHALSVLLFVSVVTVVIGYGFGVERLYSLKAFIPMSFGEALCFLLLNHAIQSVAQPLPFFARALKTFTTYWPAIAVSSVILLLSGVASHQIRGDIHRQAAAAVDTQFDDAQDAVVGRTTAYIDTLRDFKAFFESSEEVTPAEFHSYFVSSNLATNYPGFSAISFVATVRPQDKATFVAKVRKEAGALYPSYKTYNIQPATNPGTSYPVLYSEPSTTGSGFDLATDSERMQTLEAAKESGQPQTSKTINLNASQGPSAPKRSGFLISVPVYSNKGPLYMPRTVADRIAQSQGFINAIFENRTLFTDIFKDDTTQKLRLVVRNAATGEILYTHNPGVALTQKEPLAVKTINVAGQQWSLSLYSMAASGPIGLERFIPLAVIIGGGLLAAMAFWLVVAQTRRREQALLIAGSMTEDLSNERNIAVSLRVKDEAILKSIGDAVFAIDTQERITLFNPVAAKISGYSAEEAVGKPYKEVLKFVFQKNDRVNETFIRHALEGHAASMKNHTMLIRKDGQRLPVADSAAPIRDSRGELLGVIIVFRDVSREYALDRAKTEFVSLASHQLRTPLTAISWNSELLMEGEAGKLTKTQTIRVNEIQEGTKRMIALVNALLDVSRLDLDKLANDQRPSHIADLINSIESELRVGAKRGEVEIVNDINKHTPVVLADPKLMRMVVQNLISNAVKYTPPKGRVTVTLRPATAKDVRSVPGHTKISGDSVFFSVADTGYGIPKSQQDKIFNKLFRADNVRVLDVEGTGLGLYIVEQVVQKLGGKVWFESIESVGTTFYVVLPVKTKAWKSKPASELS